MKLLIDENLSPALIHLLAPDFAVCVHVRELGLKSSPDPKVWEYAAANGYTIVTKDADFHHRSFLYGHPPRVVWIRLGNCSTIQIAHLLRERQEEIRTFDSSEERSFLVLG